MEPTITQPAESLPHSEQTPATAEVGLPERVVAPAPIEQTAAASDSAGGAAPVSAGSPSLPAASGAAPAVSAPLIADDVDVIEKEWVDATEQIIERTVGDPHARDEAIEDLQIDYLKKRYGKDVKKSSK